MSSRNIKELHGSLRYQSLFLSSLNAQQGGETLTLNQNQVQKLLKSLDDNAENLYSSIIDDDENSPPVVTRPPVRCSHLSSTADSAGYFVCDHCNKHTGSHEDDQD